MAIICRLIADWNGIHSIAERSGWCFRGQANADWEMATSLERVFEREKMPLEQREDFELELIREFKRAYHQFGEHIPTEESPIEWLALMQHHGAPTRMLDFTYSAYAAAYFALEEAKTDCALFAIDPAWANKQSRQILERAGKGDAAAYMRRTTPELERKVYNAHFYKPFVKSVYPVNPFRLNERLRVQKGIFLMPGDGAISFKENFEALPGHDNAANAEKIIIRYECRKKILRDLFYMNVSRTSLFPGIDGYAKSLGIYHPAYEPLNGNDG